LGFGGNVLASRDTIELVGVSDEILIERRDLFLCQKQGIESKIFKKPVKSWVLTVTFYRFETLTRDATVFYEISMEVSSHENYVF